MLERVHEQALVRRGDRAKLDAPAVGEYDPLEISGWFSEPRILWRLSLHRTDGA
jgi:hypothetical protein